MIFTCGKCGHDEPCDLVMQEENYEAPATCPFKGENADWKKGYRMPRDTEHIEDTNEFADSVQTEDYLTTVQKIIEVKQ
jgi:hypothetical protein